MKGDSIIQLKKDSQFINEEINEKEAQEMTKYEYKSMKKTKVRKRVFENLKTIQQTHSKVREIC